MRARFGFHVRFAASGYRDVQIFRAVVEFPKLSLDFGFVGILYKLF